MTSNAWTRLAARKELRALMPMTAATAVALIAVALLSKVVPGGLSPVFGLGALAVGLAATGAWSVGHEYAYRTLGFHLSHPVARWRLLAVKLAALTIAVGGLGAVAWIAVPMDSVRTRVLMLALGTLSAVATAPALTMVCRTALAGAVFTLAIPALSWVVADIVGAVSGLGKHSDSRQQLQVAWLTYSTVGAAAVGSVAVWFLNRSLQAEGQGATRDVGGPAAAAVSPSTSDRPRQHPAWLLLKKELHLQQLPLVVAGIFVLMWSVVTLSERFTDGAAVSAMPVITLMYFAITPLLVGALASAEERQLGTLEWQRLLPMAGWQQWTVKVATVLILSALLGVGIPVLLAAIHPSADVVFSEGSVAGVLALAVTSLYVSSWSPRGLSALLVSIPAAVSVAVVLAVLTILPGWAPLTDLLFTRDFRPPTPSLLNGPLFWGPRSILIAAAAGMALVVLRFAAANHRSVERSRARIGRQVGWIGAAVCLWVLTILAVAAVNPWAFLPFGVPLSYR
ncbi:MAG: hypothetical protein ABIX28_21835 [Vicinamibacterales bacterium]